LPNLEGKIEKPKRGLEKIMKNLDRIGGTIILESIQVSSGTWGIKPRFSLG